MLLNLEQETRIKKGRLTHDHHMATRSWPRRVVLSPSLLIDISLAAPPLHKRRKGLVRRRYPSCSAGMQLTSRVVHGDDFLRTATQCGEELTAQNVPQLFKFTTWHAAIFYVHVYSYHFLTQCASSITKATSLLA